MDPPVTLHRCFPSQTVPGLPEWLSHVFRLYLGGGDETIAASEGHAFSRGTDEQAFAAEIRGHRLNTQNKLAEGVFSRLLK